MGRVVLGYDQLPRLLATEVEDSIRLGTRVVEVSWEPGRAELRCRKDRGGEFTIETRAVLITVPLGVLKTPPEEPGSIRFRPDPLRIRRALAHLATGSVVRLVVHFREHPWRDGRAPAKGANPSRLSFLHTRGAPFSVWWTTYPLRSSLAVAWSGGLAALELGRKSREEIESVAWASLSQGLGLSQHQVESRVLKTWLHDWNDDPFSRGAYSYALVAGANAAKALTTPVSLTLFFAGEATAGKGQHATVEGAIASGFRAAKQVERALGRSRLEAGARHAGP